MIADIQIQEQNVIAPMKQEPIVIVQDMDLAQVGGGAGSSLHF